MPCRDCITCRQDIFSVLWYTRRSRWNLGMMSNVNFEAAQQKQHSQGIHHLYTRVRQS